MFFDFEQRVSSQMLKQRKIFNMKEESFTAFELCAIIMVVVYGGGVL